MVGGESSFFFFLNEVFYLEFRSFFFKACLRRWQPSEWRFKEIGNRFWMVVLVFVMICCWFYAVGPVILVCGFSVPGNFSVLFSQNKFEQLVHCSSPNLGKFSPSHPPKNRKTSHKIVPVTFARRRSIGPSPPA